MTELVFALGRGADLVGVSAFCTYPSEATTLPKVGGVGDVHIETLLSLRPNVVLGVTDVPDSMPNSLVKRLTPFGIKTLIAPQRDFSELYLSIRQVGSQLGTNAEAETIVAEIHSELSNAKRDKFRDKRALVLFWESMAVASVYTAGRSGMHQELLDAMGLKNVIESTQPYSQVTLENVAALRPEIIIALAPAVKEAEARARVDSFFSPLRASGVLTAVPIVLLTSEQQVRPGPRTAASIREFVAHCEAAL